MNTYAMEIHPANKPVHTICFQASNINEAYTFYTKVKKSLLLSNPDIYTVFFLP